MRAALFAVVLLAQADDFVEFDLCFLDTNAHPWEFRPHPRGEPGSVRPSGVTSLLDAKASVGGDIHGIDCTHIGGPLGRLFVVGTPDQVRQKLEGDAR